MRENSSWQPEIGTRLHLLYGSPNHGNKESPLDELVFILLSQMTRHQAFNRAYENLKRRFLEWENLLEATEEELSECIETAGLATRRARTLRLALRKVREDQGTVSLDAIRDMPLDDAVSYLESIPGIGPKSARCVMLYAMKRPVLPIDTHTRRLAKRLGLLANEKLADEHTALERIVPEPERYGFHTNAICHGRAVCLPKYPRCGQCVIRDFCRYPETQ